MKDERRSRVTLSSFIAQGRFANALTPGYKIVIFYHYMSNVIVVLIILKLRRKLQVSHVIWKYAFGAQNADSEGPDSQTDQSLRCPHTESLDIAIYVYNYVQPMFNQCAYLGWLIWIWVLAVWICRTLFFSWHLM